LWFRFRHGETSDDRVAGKSWFASADGMVLLDSAVGVNPARAGARIATSVAHASLIVCAIVVYYTFVSVATGGASWIASHSVGATTH
jgi:hypothetical protein